MDTVHLCYAYIHCVENGPDHAAGHTARPTVEGQGHGGTECGSFAQLQCETPCWLELHAAVSSRRLVCLVQSQGVTILDHHTGSEGFLRFMEQEVSDDKTNRT